MRRTGILLMLTACILAPGCAVARFDHKASSPALKTNDQAVPADTGGDADLAADRAKPPEQAGEPIANIQPRKVIYTADMEIIVADLDRALGEARKTAERMGGYMQHLSGGSITIRVPAEQFNSAMDALSKLGPVASRKIAALDVTEQHTDLEIRISNGRAALKRLQALLDKATDVKEVLAIEKELVRMRTEMERLQGKMNLLKNRVAYATITVSFQRAAQVSDHIRVKLPFWWLSQLGLETLMDL
ncbi:MAG: DUF4349 domain-containing protein [Phycisphaerae bacterium]|nr:DUF4349 domain-containing protein [Phycisphaerae bacterium]